MFYLIKFFYAIKTSPLKGIAFLFITICMILSCGLFSSIDYKFNSYFGPKKQGSYFYALISEKENYKNIIRKVRNLPGVALVKSLDSKKVKKEVNDFFQNIHFEKDFEKDLEMIPVKVSMSYGISENSKELILRYLVKLSGEENSVVGNIIEEKIIQSGRMTFLSDWGALLLILIFLVLWLGVGLSFCREIEKISYILSNFQRKKFVGPKISLAGMLFTFSITLSVLGILSLDIHFVLILSFFLISILYVVLTSMRNVWHSH